MAPLSPELNTIKITKTPRRISHVQSKNLFPLSLCDFPVSAAAVLSPAVGGFGLDSISPACSLRLIFNGTKNEIADDANTKIISVTRIIQNQVSAQGRK